MKSKTGSDLRMGSNGKHIELTPWKACLVYITVWGNSAQLCSCQTCANTKKLKAAISSQQTLTAGFTNSLRWLLCLVTVTQ